MKIRPNFALFSTFLIISFISQVFSLNFTESLDKLEDKWADRLESIGKLLPKNVKINLTEQTQTSLYQVLFQSNNTLFADFEEKVVDTLDSNKDGIVNKTEIDSNILGVFGKKNLFTRFLSKFVDISQDQYEELDENGDGKVTTQELQDKISKFVNADFSIPKDYVKVCNVVYDKVSTCVANSTNPQMDETYQEFGQEELLCRSGFSWIFNNFQMEECLLKAPSKSSSCLKAINKCITKNSKKSSSTPEKELSLSKRAITPTGTFITSASRTAASLSLIAIFADLWLSVPLIILGIVVILGTFYLAIYLSSQASVNKYWTTAQSYEKWELGLPMPPCGTPFVYWSDKCGAIGSKQARNCTYGQVFDRSTCRGWWVQGSRTCSLLGCQSLCYDVSTNNCPQGQKFQLGYDEHGKSIVVPYQDYQ